MIIITKKYVYPLTNVNSVAQSGLVERHGYPAEEYKVQTPDGYLLRLHRIPGSPANPKAPGKPVVYIQHGILASSDMFVLGGPDHDLGIIFFID